MQQEAHMKINAFALLTLVSLAGCATAPPAPVTGPKATVTIQWDKPALNTPVRLHDGTCTKDGAKRIALLNSKAIGWPETGDTVTIEVPAGKPVGLSVGAGRREWAMEYKGGFKSQEFLRVCETIIDFTPVDGARYVVETDLPPSEVTRQCVQKLLRFEGGAKVAEASARPREACRIPLEY